MGFKYYVNGFLLLIYVELYTDTDIFSIISPFWCGFVRQELWTRLLFLYLGGYLIVYLYLFTYCCLRCHFCFHYMLFKSLLFWFFDPIVCIYLLLMYCFNCHISMSFCIFKLSLFIFIVVIIVGLKTVISFVKLNI